MLCDVCKDLSSRFHVLNPAWITVNDSSDVTHTEAFLSLRVNLILFRKGREESSCLFGLSVCFLNAAGFCRPSLELRDG